MIEFLAVWWDERTACNVFNVPDENVVSD